MPNLNQLIITSADYKIMLIVLTASGSRSFPLLTVDSIDWEDASENEDIYAVGTEDPIGNKSNANKYSGKITLEIGESNALLSVCGFNSAIRIRNATLAITAIVGAYSKVYNAVNINRDASSTKAKDKSSMTSWDFSAVSLT